MKIFRYRFLFIKIIAAAAVMIVIVSIYLGWTKSFHEVKERDNQNIEISIQNDANILSRGLIDSASNSFPCSQDNSFNSTNIKQDCKHSYGCLDFSKLQGKLEMPDFLRVPPPTLEELEAKYKNRRPALPHCKEQHKIAIIIPLRGREMQLRGLLSHMHPVWQRQQLDYTVYTITQSGNQLFNRAKLMNVGFSEAIKDRKYDCFIFHDVDLLLKNDKCLYWCPRNADRPRHISTYIDKREYKVHSYNLEFCVSNIYKNMTVEVFGGVSMFTEEQFKSLNGFSNLYWGWGSEDDDLFLRVWRKGYEVHHETSEACSFQMLYHSREKRNRKNIARHLLLKHALSRQYDDGLNSLSYSVLSYNKSFTYTNITVDIGRPSARLREMSLQFTSDKKDVKTLPCFESLLWMSQQLIRKRGNM